MQPKLVTEAAKLIPETGTLVNVVRLRVRQLSAGHRPLVLTAPGTGLADIALTEIAAGKIISEAAPENTLENANISVLPAPRTTKKAP